MLAAARPELPVWKDAATGMRFTESAVCPEPGFVLSSAFERDEALVGARQVLAEKHRSRLAAGQRAKVDRLVAAGLSLEVAELLAD